MIHGHQSEKKNSPKSTDMTGEMAKMMPAVMKMMGGMGMKGSSLNSTGMDMSQVSTMMKEFKRY